LKPVGEVLVLEAVEAGFATGAFVVVAAGVGVTGFLVSAVVGLVRAAALAVGAVAVDDAPGRSDVRGGRAAGALVGSLVAVGALLGSFAAAGAFVASLDGPEGFAGALAGSLCTEALDTAGLVWAFAAGLAFAIELVAVVLGVVGVLGTVFGSGLLAARVLEADALLVDIAAGFLTSVLALVAGVPLALVAS